jgi:CheY-like chemotaxis protein
MDVPATPRHLPRNETGSSGAASLTPPHRPSAPGRKKSPPQRQTHLERGLRILIAEDHPQIRDLLCNFLSSRGAYCVSARTGAQTLALAKSETGFNAVILDVNLPDGHSIILVPSLRALFPRSIIVALTGSYHEPDRHEAIASGCNVYLAKPFPLESLWGIVTAATVTTASTSTNSWAELQSHSPNLTATLLDRLSKPSAKWARAQAQRDWCALRHEAHLRRNDALLSNNAILILAAARLEESALSENLERLTAAEALWNDAVAQWVSRSDSAPLKPRNSDQFRF